MISLSRYLIERERKKDLIIASHLVEPSTESLLSYVSVKPMQLKQKRNILKMPFMQICTTLPRTQIPQNLGQLVSIELSKILPNKSVDKFCVHIIPDQVICSDSQAGMSNSLLAVATFRAIGAVSAEDNRNTTKVIADLLHQHLNIPRSKVQMFFYDNSATMFARNGILLADRERLEQSCDKTAKHL